MFQFWAVWRSFKYSYFNIHTSKDFLALKTRAQAKDNHCYWSKIIAEKLLEGILHKDILKNARNLKLSTLTGAEGGSSCRDGRTMCPRSRFSTLINRTIPTNIEFIVYEVTVQRWHYSLATVTRNNDKPSALTKTNKCCSRGKIPGTPHVSIVKLWLGRKWKKFFPTGKRVEIIFKSLSHAILRMKSKEFVFCLYFLEKLLILRYFVGNVGGSNLSTREISRYLSQNA